MKTEIYCRTNFDLIKRDTSVRIWRLLCLTPRFSKILQAANQCRDKIARKKTLEAIIADLGMSVEGFIKAVKRR